MYKCLEKNSLHGYEPSVPDLANDTSEEVRLPRQPLGARLTLGNGTQRPLPIQQLMFYLVVFPDLFEVV